MSRPDGVLKVVSSRPRDEDQLYTDEMVSTASFCSLHITSTDTIPA